MLLEWRRSDRRELGGDKIAKFLVGVEQEGSLVVSEMCPLRGLDPVDPSRSVSSSSSSMRRPFFWRESRSLSFRRAVSDGVGEEPSVRGDMGLSFAIQSSPSLVSAIGVCPLGGLQ